MTIFELIVFYYQSSMKIRSIISVILTLLSLMAFGKTKSLRELVLEADIIAIVDRIPDPFFSNDNKIALSDHQTVVVLDSVQIISHLKKGKTDLSKKN